MRCPGYSRKLRWSSKHERFATEQSSPIGYRTSTGDEAGINDEVENVTAYSQEVVLTGMPSTPAIAADTATSAMTQLRWANVLVECHDDSSNPSVQPCSTVSRIPEDRSACSARSQILHSLIDMPTVLIEYWFSSVCPMWSTFDSHANFNRRIAQDHWSCSQPAFYAMQAMSAACLEGTLPNLKGTVPSLLVQAKAAIHEGIVKSYASPGVVRIDLLFAIIALGTSLHWSDSRIPSDSLIGFAYDLLRSWKSNEDLTAIETILYAYFEQALTYWRMLLSVAGKCGSDKSSAEEAAARRPVNPMTNVFVPSRDCAQSQRCRPSLALEGSRPNSWCGVSGEVIDVFGRVMALCRIARQRHRGLQPIHSPKVSGDALYDLMLAREYQAELLGMDFGGIIALNERLGLSLETFDQNTPVSHLLLVAQAYRLASLLQLYLTFEELYVVPSETTAASGCMEEEARFQISEHDPRKRKLATFALKLVSILEEVPESSGSKSIQVVLFLSAAAGLQFDTQPQRAVSHGGSEDLHCMSTTSKTHSFRVTQCVLGGFDAFRTIHDYCSKPGCNICTLQGRQLVLGRLAKLQQALPAKPVKVALGLIQAIWASYDDSMSSNDQVHWLDIMEDTGLQTMFG